MKKITYIFLTFILLFLTTNVYADHIYSVDMDVYLDEYGTASITETWDVKASSGSEWYKQLYNIGNQKLSDFTVSMDGNSLTYKNWNVDESLSEKSGYYGINYVSDGIELCFGKGDMNRHKFVLSYKLSNVIFNTSDAQVLYNTFLPNVTLDDFKIVVRSFYDFPDTLDVWGFGYKGYAYVNNSIIVMSNEDNPNLSEDYVVLLAKFPVNTFNTDNSYSQFSSFDDVLTKAQEGSYKFKKDFGEIIASILSFIFTIAFPLIVIIIGLIKSKNAVKYGTKKIFIDSKDKNFKDVPYFRDIPCNKDIFKAYWISCQYDLIKNQTDFLGAILLKWLKDGNVENVTVQSKFLKKDERAIKLVKDDNLSDRERKLYQMMLNASVDGTLESKEFTKWCKTHYRKILDWFDDAIDDVSVEFINNKYLTYTKKTFSSGHQAGIELKGIADEVAGLKKFLNEFSMIKDKESIEVKLWEYYLIYAQIFGIAKKVAKEFKDLYPNVITDEYYNDIIFIHTMSYQGVNAASSARRAAESYSSGGGGFSFGGGGGGSFGGGGSMGGR